MACCSGMMNSAFIPKTDVFPWDTPHLKLDLGVYCPSGLYTCTNCDKMFGDRNERWEIQFLLYELLKRALGFS